MEYKISLDFLILAIGGLLGPDKLFMIILAFVSALLVRKPHEANLSNKSDKVYSLRLLSLFCYCFFYLVLVQYPSSAGGCWMQYLCSSKDPSKPSHGHAFPRVQLIYHILRGLRLFTVPDGCAIAAL